MRWTLDEERRARECEHKRERRASETAEQREARLSKGRRYTAANKEALAARKREYYKANREAIAARKREYCKTNREAIAAGRRAYRKANKEAVAAYDRAYQATPIGKYSKHKTSAKERGVPFLLTFDEWWGVWKYYWHMRDGTGNLHMCRTNDEGGYELGNVRIDTKGNNTRERHGTL